MAHAITLEHFPHKIAALYPDKAAAEEALQALQGQESEDIHSVLLSPETLDVDSGIEPEGEETRDHFIRDILVGGGLGTVGAAAAAGAAAAVVPTIFVSAPVVGPLLVAGYGATIGGTVGAVLGIKVKESLLVGMIKDALKEGHYLVVVHAADTNSRQRAEEVVKDTMAEEIRHA